MENLDSWRIPLYLLPIALAMLWIRRRETLEGVTLFAELSPGQKAWILIHALPPGQAAHLLARLPGQCAQGYLQEASRIQGDGQHLVAEVLKEFCRALPPDWTRGAGRDADQALALVSQAACEKAAEFDAVLIGLWPPAAGSQAFPRPDPVGPATEEPGEGGQPAGAPATRDEEEG